MFNLELYPYIEYAIYKFVIESEENNRIDEDLKIAEKMLKYMYSKDYKIEHPEHSKGYTLALISKFTLVFKNLLAARDRQIYSEKSVILTLPDSLKSDEAL